ncbi:hypothetical protein EPUL_002307 [Erysiphe pulchra]|uniref:CCHC-type domain-containing protein n=1 Tax=Erysiphe pulchra TaxID=225359 RepID=A0A2S4PV43_9PEZI|nr:hypothetical protein EPUL_002307 [Erysiphe pulchra]
MPQQFHQQQGKGGYVAPNNRTKKLKSTPPCKLSRHLIVNGSKSFDGSMGDLSIRCGDMGHRKLDCSTNCASLETEGNNLKYRDIDSSNWRGRDLGIARKSSVSSSDQKMQIKDVATEDDNKILTCEEYDGVPCNTSRTEFTNATKMQKKSIRKERRIIKHLGEIFGHQGKGPVNYKKLAEEIMVEVSLMDLFQISPDLSKAFRILSTRVNERNMKEKIRSELPKMRQMERRDNAKESEVLFRKAAGPQYVTEEKSFRIQVVVKAKKNGKQVKVSLPTSITQADQGSGMVIVTVGFLKKFGLPIKNLSERGMDGLTMNVADGTSARLTHYSQFEIRVLGIWRKVEAFVRPFSGKDTTEVHLLLGVIEIGDPERGEKCVKIQGPVFVESEEHKLVLFPGRKEEMVYVESSSDDSEDPDSENSDESSDDDSLSDIFEEGNSEKQSTKGRSSKTTKLSSNQVGIETLSSPERCEEISRINFNAPRININKEEERNMSITPQEQIDKWFNETGVRIGELNPEQLSKIKRLLYTNQDLNSTDLGDLLYTDLYVHRALAAREGILDDGIKFELYESTIKANGRLFDWKAMAQLVDKSDNPG